MSKKALIDRYEKRIEEWLKRIDDPNILSFDELNKLYFDMFTDGYKEGLGHSKAMILPGLDSDEFELYLETRESLQDFIAKSDYLYNLPYLNGNTVSEMATQYWLEGDKPALKRLMDSEYHRAYGNGAYDMAEIIGDIPSYEIKKTWVTAGDERVRDTHVYLDGVTIGKDETFYTFDGDEALFPGGFESARNNANCRCILIYSKA